jgi:hypothetical protein
MLKDMTTHVFDSASLSGFYFIFIFSMNPKLGVGIYMPPSLSFFSSQILVWGVKACSPICILFVCKLLSGD